MDCTKQESNNSSSSTSNIKSLLSSATSSSSSSLHKMIDQKDGKINVSTIIDSLQRGGIHSDIEILSQSNTTVVVKLTDQSKSTSSSTKQLNKLPMTRAKSVGENIGRKSLPSHFLRSNNISSNNGIGVHANISTRSAMKHPSVLATTTSTIGSRPLSPVTLIDNSSNTRPTTHLKSRLSLPPSVFRNNDNLDDSFPTDTENNEPESTQSENQLYSVHSLRKIGPPKEDSWKSSKDECKGELGELLSFARKPSLVPSDDSSSDDNNTDQMVSSGCLKPSQILSIKSPKATPSTPASTGKVKSLASMFVSKSDDTSNEEEEVEDDNQGENTPTVLYDTSALKKVDVPNDTRWKDMKQQNRSSSSSPDDVNNQEPEFVKIELKRPSSSSSSQHNSNTGSDDIPCRSIMSKSKLGITDNEIGRKESEASRPISSSRSTERPSRSTTSSTFVSSDRKSIATIDKHGSLVQASKDKSVSTTIESSSKLINERKNFAQDGNDSQTSDPSVESTYSGGTNKKLSTSKELEAVRAMALTRNWNSTTSIALESRVPLDDGCQNPRSERRVSSRRSEPSSTGYIVNRTSKGRKPTRHSMSINSATKRNHSQKASGSCHPPLSFEDVRKSLKKVSSQKAEKKIVQRWKPIDSNQNRQKQSSARKELEEIRAMRLAQQDPTREEKSPQTQPSMVLLESEGERFNSRYAHAFVSSTPVLNRSRSTSYVRASRPTKAFFIPSEDKISHRRSNSLTSVSSVENRSLPPARIDTESVRSVRSVGSTSRTFRSTAYLSAQNSPSNRTSISADAIDRLPSSLSMNSQSEYTTSTEGYYSYAGGEDRDNRYIQISLSSGGIATKFVQNVAISPTEESERIGRSTMNLDPCLSGDESVSSETSSPEKLRVHGDRRKSRELLKGAAKRFFFGKKRKSSF